MEYRRKMSASSILSGWDSILPNRQACIAFSVASQTGTFTAVVSPTGNPKTLGYYEKQGSEYFLTEDTSVVSGKTYYSKS